jgi:salicylate hydroxylase
MAAAPGDPASAFRRYEMLRRPRASRIQRLSRRYGRLYHLRGPLRLARNLILERRGEQQALRGLDWLYRHEAGPA